MSGADLEWRALWGGVILIGAGAYGVLRSRQLARENQSFIESGKETYFEQRRAWEHYPSERPPTDPAKIKRLGWLGLIVGVALLLFAILSIYSWE